MKNVVELSARLLTLSDNTRAIALDDTLKAPKRGLVFFNVGKTGKVTAYGVDVTVRNADIPTVLRSVLKLALAEERLRLNANKRVANDKECEYSEKKLSSSDLKKVLNSRYVGVTDKFGHLVPGSLICPKAKGGLRKDIMPSQTSTLYYFGVQKPWNANNLDEIPWDNLTLSTMLNHEVRAITHFWQFVDDLDLAIERIDASNRQECLDAINAERKKNALERAVATEA